MNARISLTGCCAIVGAGETAYLRGDPVSAPNLILDACASAIADAGLMPSDVRAILPPEGYISSEELAAHLGVDEVRYSATVHMGGASPTASLQSAAMTIATGVADTVLVTFGWDGYTARPTAPRRPDRPSRLPQRPDGGLPRITDDRRADSTIRRVLRKVCREHSIKSRRRHRIDARGGTCGGRRSR